MLGDSFAKYTGLRQNMNAAVLLDYRNRQDDWVNTGSRLARISPAFSVSRAAVALALS